MSVEFFLEEPRFSSPIGSFSVFFFFFFFFFFSVLLHHLLLLSRASSVFHSRSPVVLKVQDVSRLAEVRRALTEPLEVFFAGKDEL